MSEVIFTHIDENGAHTMIKTLAEFRAEWSAHWKKVEQIESTEQFKARLLENHAEVYQVMGALLAEVSDIDFEGVPDRRTRELFDAVNDCENLIDKLRNGITGE